MPTASGRGEVVRVQPYPQQTRPPVLLHEPLPIWTVAPGCMSVARRLVKSLGMQFRRPLPHAPLRQR